MNKNTRYTIHYGAFHNHLGKSSHRTIESAIRAATHESRKHAADGCCCGGIYYIYDNMEDKKICPWEEEMEL